MIDLVSNFPNESFLATTDYMSSYNGNTSNYNLTNLETTPMSCLNDIVVLDNIAGDSYFEANSNNYDRNCNSSNSNTSNQFTDLMYERGLTNGLQAINNGDGSELCSYSSGNDDMSNKLTQNKMVDNPDFMIVSSEEIIDSTDDILDLTNDEVEQIFESNLIPSQVFDGVSPKLNLSPTVKGRINVASNLIRTFDTTTVDMRPLETPKIIPECVIGEINEPIICSGSDESTLSKKKCGRPKGARRTSMNFK